MICTTGDLKEKYEIVKVINAHRSTNSATKDILKVSKNKNGIFDELLNELAQIAEKYLADAVIAIRYSHTTANKGNDFIDDYDLYGTAVKKHE
ncbi:MAG: hypothetical protein WCG95_06835 [bacterium]